MQGQDSATAVRYAKHAAKIGADALIALPPPDQPGPDAVLSYYRQIGEVTERPLFVQAVGNMSVDLLLQMWKTIPTIRLIKDEAGEPLMRVGRLREGSRDELQVFTA